MYWSVRESQENRKFDIIQLFLFVSKRRTTFVEGNCRITCPQGQFIRLHITHNCASLPFRENEFSKWIHVEWGSNISVCICGVCRNPNSLESLHQWHPQQISPLPRSICIRSYRCCMSISFHISLIERKIFHDANDPSSSSNTKTETNISNMDIPPTRRFGRLFKQMIYGDLKNDTRPVCNPLRPLF